MSGNARALHPNCRTTLFFVLLLASIFALVPGCGDGSNKKARNPVPVLTAVSPAAAVAGGAGFTLTATGSGFVRRLRGALERRVAGHGFRERHAGHGFDPGKRHRSGGYRTDYGG